jgi:hypothetical protein
MPPTRQPTAEQLADKAHFVAEAQRVLKKAEEDEKLYGSDADSDAEAADADLHEGSGQMGADDQREEETVVVEGHGTVGEDEEGLQQVKKTALDDDEDAEMRLADAEKARTTKPLPTLANFPSPPDER